MIQQRPVLKWLKMLLAICISFAVPKRAVWFSLPIKNQSHCPINCSTPGNTFLSEAFSMTDTQHPPACSSGSVIHSRASATLHWPKEKTHPMSSLLSRKQNFVHYIDVFDSHFYIFQGKPSKIVSKFNFFDLELGRTRLRKVRSWICSLVTAALRDGVEENPFWNYFRVLWCAGLLVRCDFVRKWFFFLRKLFHFYLWFFKLPKHFRSASIN